ncbi:hypothetical protein V6C27_14475 [Peptococcaceae bacterium 1198_IL3148]
MKKVYVLGAGSSAGYEGSYIGITSPVSKNFFSKATDVISVHSIKGRKFYDNTMTYHNLFKFINDFWGIAPEQINSSGNNIDMEEVLTLLHIELEENPHSLPLLRASGEYMMLMALTFDKILYGAPCPHHIKLAKNLSCEDVVISFNYELLMDNSLLSTGMWYPTDGYGVKCGILSDQKLEQPKNKSHVYLLKLHGSFNWLYCSGCRQLFTAIEKNKQELRLVCNHSDKVFSNHMGCKHPLQPIIIPPTMMKNYDSMPFTQQLWHQARAALANADQIVIIGYSFPPTDFRTKWLFRKAMLESNKKCRKVILVNHATGDKLASMLQQYKSLMRTNDIESYPTIADYVATL